MAVPKKKSSSSRGGHRRSHDSIASPNLAVCSNCQEMRPSHRVCPACGWYDGREVVQTQE